MHRLYRIVLVLAFLAVGAALPAAANDNIVSTVTIPNGQPQPMIVNNGVPNGTIQLWYTVTGNQFPCGPFAIFNLGLTDQQGSGVAPTYPVTLNLVQSGAGTPVQFAPTPASFSVTGTNWTDTSQVQVSIDCSKIPQPEFDGQDIVGNLNEETNPQGAHLNTISTIQVHIKLVIPTPCLKLYSLETDLDGTILSTITVRANKKSQVTSTNPGQISVDGLVANTCPTDQSFDLLVTLDPEWRTNPHDNPGNAVFTYTTTGEVDPSTFNLSAFGTGTPQHQNLCIRNVTLPAGDSFLTTVHSEINTSYNGGLTVSLLPTNPNAFTFSVTLYPANSGCSGTPLDNNLVGPSNPAISLLPYTVQ